MYQRLEFNSLIPRQSGGCIIHTVKKGYQLTSDQLNPKSDCILQDNLLTLFGYQSVVCMLIISVNNLDPDQA